MIDFKGTFEKMNREYEKLYQSYYDFKANTDNKHKQILLDQIKIFSKEKSKFKTTIKNLYLGKEN